VTGALRTGGIHYELKEQITGPELMDHHIKVLMDDLDLYGFNFEDVEQIRSNSITHLNHEQDHKGLLTHIYNQIGTHNESYSRLKPVMDHLVTKMQDMKFEGASALLDHLVRMTVTGCSEFDNKLNELMKICMGIMSLEPENLLKYHLQKNAPSRLSSFK
jgi:polyhydroxyalkanoate synthesis regulator phasin